MNVISNIEIGGVTYPIEDITNAYSKVQVSNLLATGIALGTIDINGQSYVIYAPNNSSSGSRLEAFITNATDLTLNNYSN